ncbi:unnamed protein product [Arctogadus glacialis]
MGLAITRTLLAEEHRETPGRPQSIEQKNADDDIITAHGATMTGMHRLFTCVGLRHGNMSFFARDMQVTQMAVVPCGMTCSLPITSHRHPPPTPCQSSMGKGKRKQEARGLGREGGLEHGSLGERS